MAELAKTVAGAMIISVGGGKDSAAQELLIWNDNAHARRRFQGTLDLF